MAAGGGYLYYTPYNNGAGAALVKLKSDKTSSLTLYTCTGSDYVGDVALDLPNSQVFFVNDGIGTGYIIYKSSITTAGATNIYNNGSYSINALTAGNGYVFFAIANSPWTFSRMTSSGGSETTIFTPTSGGTVYSSSYDVVNKNLYFYYQGNGDIYKSTNSDGSSPSILKNVGASEDITTGCMAAAPNTVLPVELTSFTALLKENTAQLSWATATEVNNYGFDVQRRAVPGSQPSVIAWGKVGFVQGNGTSNTRHEYSYTDNVGSAGTYSYRLKQIDRDGAFKYSQEVQVTFGAPIRFALSQNYPDPFNPSTTIQFTVPSDGRGTLRVYNSLGQEVVTLFDGVVTAGDYHQIKFDGSNLASGIYFARLEFNGQMEVKKMTLLK
jgi:Domain of unknown function (DUF5050)/Secretion system C-terminal sorting domain